MHHLMAYLHPTLNRIHPLYRDATAVHHPQVYIFFGCYKYLNLEGRAYTEWTVYVRTWSSTY